LRSIFTNPLYANERFKHNNCTQYIQALPSEDSQEARIHYTWEQFRNETLMEAAIQAQLGKVTSLGDKQQLLNTLMRTNSTVYLYFLIFQVAAYLAIHYNKRLESAHFHFILEDEVWSIAGAESIRISPLKTKEFARAELWDPPKVHFCEEEEGKGKPQIFLEKPVERSLLYQTIENTFDETNSALRRDVSQFVKTQINRVRKVEDQKISKAIFDILHPGQGPHFYEFLNCP
jgi:hypothetical protein